MRGLNPGHRVRHGTSGRTGTVLDVITGNVADAVFVEWDDTQIDSHWNRYQRSWEPSAHLEGTAT